MSDEQAGQAAETLTESELSENDREEEFDENNQAKSLESIVEGDKDAPTLAPGWRGKIYVFMTQPSSSTPALLWSMTMVGFILASIFVFCIQTLPPFYSDNPGPPWSTLEVIISVVFTIDFVLRLLTCSDIKSFMKDPFTVIDILSIVPFYLGLIIPAKVSGLKVIRAVRLIRIFRVFRLGRYSSSIIVVVQTFYLSRHILISALSVMMFVVTFLATMIYYAERGEWSDEANTWMKFGSKSNIQSITNSLWFTTITMTTVGYGDIVPTTVAGKFLTTVSMFLGTVGVGFTMTIISTNFTTQWDSLKQLKKELTRRQKLYILFTDPNSSNMALGISVFMFTTVALSIVLFLASTVEPFNTDNEDTMFILDSFVIAVFIIDYVVRFATTEELLEFLKDGFNMIDLLTILPYFLDLLSSRSAKGVVILRFLRQVRVFRVLRLGKYSQGLRIMSKTLQKSRREVYLLFFILPIVLVLSSSIMYYIERGDFIDGDFCIKYTDGVCQKSQFNSVVATFWWCIQTISTLGYGDMIPQTFWGRIWGAATALLGLAVIAFPVAVLGNTFAIEWQKRSYSKLSKKIAASKLILIEEKEQDRLAHQKLRASGLPNYHPRKIHYTFKDPHFSKTASIIQKIYMCIIVISITTISYDSVENPKEERGKMWYFETFIVALFTFEYVATTLFAPKVFHAVLKISSLVDLASIVPYYVGQAPGINAPSLSILRVVRLFRLFKIFEKSRLAKVLALIKKSVNKNTDAMILLLFVMCVEVIFTSSVIFYAERGTYEEGKGWYINGHRSSFQNVPEAFWWSIVTLCTVGYGDYLPVTWLGKVIAGLTVILGILTMAFPITIVCNTFCEEWLKYVREKKKRGKKMVSTVTEEQTSTPKGRGTQTPRMYRQSPSVIVQMFKQLMKVKTKYVDFQFLEHVVKLTCPALHVVSGFLGVISMTEGISRSTQSRILIVQGIFMVLSIPEMLYRMVASKTHKELLIIERLLEIYSMAVFMVSVAYDESYQGLLSLRIFWFFHLFYLYPEWKISKDFFAVFHTLLSSFESLVLIAVLDSFVVVFFSSVMWYLERGTLEDGVWMIDGERSKFQSIPESFWWTVVTMATVGYGDVAPITIGGRLFAGIVICTGMLSLALPVAILSSHFLSSDRADHTKHVPTETITATTSENERHALSSASSVSSKVQREVLARKKGVGEFNPASDVVNAKKP